MSAYDDAAARLDQAPATPYYNLSAKTVGNPGGLGGTGHRTSFFGVLADILTVVGEVIARAIAAGQSAAAAAASAATALSAPGTNATSTTGLLIATGAKSFTIQTGKSIVTGMWLIAASAATPANYMVGQVTSYDSGTGELVLNVTSIGGAGAPADWVISITTALGALTPNSRLISTAGLATGGGDLSADRTITVPAAAAAEVRTATDNTKALTALALAGAAAKQTLTDAATVNWAMGSGFNAIVTLGGNRTLAAPTGMKEGYTYALEVVQDGTGTRVPALNAAYEFGVVGTPIFSTAAGKRDIIFAYCYDAATPKFRCSFSRDA